MVADELVRYAIQLEGRYTRNNMFSQFCQGFTNKLVGLAHQPDFIFSLEINLHLRSSQGKINKPKARLRRYGYGPN